MQAGLFGKFCCKKTQPGEKSGLGSKYLRAQEIQNLALEHDAGDRGTEREGTGHLFLVVFFGRIGQGRGT